jgi:hypothetical protein
LALSRPLTTPLFPQQTGLFKTPQRKRNTDTEARGRDTAHEKIRAMCARARELKSGKREEENAALLLLLLLLLCNHVPPAAAPPPQAMVHEISTVYFEDRWS